MSIVQSIQRNTITITAGLSYLDVTLGVTITNLNRAELVIDCKTGQSTVNLTNMCVSGRITSTTNVRFDRGGNTGAIVVHFHVIEYTVASGVLVDRGTGILDAATKNITLTSRTRANCYSRLFMKTSNNTSFQTIMMTHDVTSDTNLQIVGNGIDTSITYDYQRIYIPDATVHHFSGTATGTSYPVSLSGLGVVKEQAFCIVSMRGASAVDNDEFKGANLSSNTQCDIYSNFADNHYFTLQVVHRAANRVERNYSTFAATSFNVTWINPVMWSMSYINLAAPYGYFAPATYSNDAADFMPMSQLNGDYAITLGKYRGTQTSYVVSEVIYIDGYGTTKTYYCPYWTFGGTGGK